MAIAAETTIIAVAMSLLLSLLASGLVVRQHGYTVQSFFSGDGGHFHSHRCMTESRARKYLLPERVSPRKEKGGRIWEWKGWKGSDDDARKRSRERERKREGW